jgi:hypothetical protein
MFKLYRATALAAAAMALVAGVAHAQSAPVATQPQAASEQSGPDAVLANAGLSYSGDVHAATGYQFRGAAFSNNSPSVGADITLQHTSGVFGSLSVDTVNLAAPVHPGDRAWQAFTDLKVGYTRNLAGVQLAGGLSQYDFEGAGGMGNLAFTEAFADAAWKGLDLQVNYNIAGASNEIAGESRGDTYAQLSYTLPLGDYTALPVVNKVSLGGDVGYTWYGNRHPGASDNLSLAQLRVSYAVSPKVDVNLIHELGYAHAAYGGGNTADNDTMLSGTLKF